MTDHDYISIQRLQSAYADVVTRRAWVELELLFESEALITLDLADREPMNFIGPAAIGEFIATSIERFEFFQFVILNSVVNIEGTDATGRMYMTELRQDTEGNWSQIYGLYVDRYRRDDGSWRFAQRRYNSLARPTSDLAVFDFPANIDTP
jgi:hypothetical protein